ncbi:MAG TPA: B12-binding domain-containing radical SAM protein [Candidatus Acidoferrales bacterium]|nr:B12-binding domain-containing radical SAM protein [Candidatus Acidoferrales bacterium]
MPEPIASLQPFSPAPAAGEGVQARFAPLGPAIKALMIWPKFPPSFWGFQGMMTLLREKAAMPPLGLITVAALCPPNWAIRLVDRAFDELSDADILWADLVMISGMHVQKADIFDLLARARRLGKRTIVGGPFASSEPDRLLQHADHVVVGEPDEAFAGIAEDLETGRARRLYSVGEKPDVSRTPAPRFELLRLEKYALMTVQFSRGCPFQCEFCDIITLYGRRPRTKRPGQLLGELQALVDLGWRKPVFIVDDNFIGNHKLALQLAREMKPWLAARGYPLLFFTEASMDLAERPELIEAMVEANFGSVFVGIESPSKESLAEAKKYQNLRRDPLESIRFIQGKGLWVTAGFIVGFDSDTPEIFDQQREFIERAAIPWAMAGFLQAPPTTPLYDRMRKQGRLLEESVTSNFVSPNFRTVMPLPVLLRGVRDVLTAVYSPEAFYERAYRSLDFWHVAKAQKATQYPRQYRGLRGLASAAGTACRSVFHQGIRSSYRQAYWSFVFRLLGRWCLNPPKLSLGFNVLLSGHHFINYAKDVAAQLDAQLSQPAMAEAPAADQPLAESWKT